MKKLLTKAAVIGGMLVAGASFNGCSDFQQGMAVGAVAGVVGSQIYNYHGHNFGANRNAMYRAGVRDGCRSAEYRYTRSRYRWRNYVSYRNGWRAGYNACRY